MKKEEKKEYVNKKGLRLDGRKVDETRPIKITAGVLKNAKGSCYLEWGINKVLVSVQGPREVLPKHMANPLKAIVKFTYRMAAFSVPDRKNPRPGRRDIEISKVCGEALEKAILLEKYPNTQIEVWAQVLDSNAGSRVAVLTAASVALADAGIPMKDLVTAVAVGRADGKIIVDLNKEEEDAPDAVDMPIAMMTNSQEIVLLQMDGLFSKKEWEEAYEMSLKALEDVKKHQINALKQQFKEPIETKTTEKKEDNQVFSKSLSKNSPSDETKKEKHSSEKKVVKTEEKEIKSEVQ
ncbi:MAG: exosome complex exonuclease Rrp41 [Candidatus Diapherotrites archaeon CG10_big_fil_rev_8_21_14_0_10_31_34]|nr:MAG: exosome complex exonuclease Rrp41 [Candidatus Diapherotrites archaeon CG10_big_fil_rev_8_21_14_0_10_31_34]